MSKIEDVIIYMRQNSRNVRFSDLCKVCVHYFGVPRQRGSSHRIYKTPWQGDPRINIQNHQGKAKAYQVKQVLLAIERLEVDHAHKNR
ncbi:MAG: toxin HicA [Syntrophales bacterium LBB04]|nr:toxin HicA [Syntrophales bacterium LBB04]